MSEYKEHIKKIINYYTKNLKIALEPFYDEIEEDIIRITFGVNRNNES